METMQVSEFKARAIATLKRVQKTGRPVLVTIRGRPVAEIVPPPAERKRGIVLGAGRELMSKRPSDRELIRLDFSSEWESGA